MAKKQEDMRVQYTAPDAAPAPDGELEDRLRELAQELAAQLADAPRGRELLSGFVSELFLSMAEQERRERRRRKQAEVIAAAKARGVQFGPARKPLPEGFVRCYRAWQGGRMTVTQAAEACGMSRTSFYREIARMKELEDCSA